MEILYWVKNVDLEFSSDLHVLGSLKSKDAFEIDISIHIYVRVWNVLITIPSERKKN